MMKRAFTLVEMMVVVAMISIIAAALTTSVQRARTRSMIARATQEVREMTNAILAFEQYAQGHTLAAQATGDSWRDCTEGNMAMILGRATGESGEEVPVLFNGAVSRGALCDPWGRPYQYMIDKTGTLGNSLPQLQTAAAIPNYYRLSDRERGRP